MGRGLNKVMIIGRLGRDPELRYTPSGRAVSTFTVATSRSWNTSNGERRTETEWFNVVAWGSLAEICNQLLRKGTQVYIEGRLHTRRWEDENGVRHYRTEIVANEMVVLSDRNHHNAPTPEASDQATVEAPQEFPESLEEEDEFPF